jgi:hypothetical protein
VLALGLFGCSVSQLLGRPPAATLTPTRTPRPTWTPVGSGLRMATPTLDPTRFPYAPMPLLTAATPQVFVPGSGQPIVVPQSPGGVAGVQTVVVIIVTATPVPPPTGTPPPPPPPTSRPGPSPTPGPPTATPTITPTPVPPVMVEVTVDQANVRQGPGVNYPVVTQLEIGTRITVVGRNAAGDWWRVCCVNGADVWIATAVVAAEGPLWTVAEVTNIPAPPPAASAAATSTPAPTPTMAWKFRLEGTPEARVLNQNYFRVDAVIYNGATPLWGYKLKIRKWSTGQEWLSSGSQSFWIWTVIQWPNDGRGVNTSADCPSPRTGLQCLRSNLKWDSNGVGVPMGDDVWEVTATDGAGTPLSEPVRLTTSVANSQWYYVVFTSKK